VGLLSLQASRRFTAAQLDLIAAFGAAIVALGVYLRTLAPGLVSEVDTPMFQFVGRVLGVAHNPGYPLYVLLTFPFSFLPVGSLAYRINLFSALMGAVAVFLTFFVARRLGCRRAASLAAAMGLAFGPVFWSQAVIAEVYTLHAAIIAGMLLTAITWAHTGRAAYFYATVAIFATGLGNHTTLVGFAPGLALFAVLQRPGFVLRTRTLIGSTAILIAGLSQYLFILIRSQQPGAYVESRVTDLGDLARVMLARQFQERLFAFSWRTVVFERVPALIQDVLVSELTVVGAAFAAIGVVRLIRRRPAEAVLLLTGGGAVLVFALNYAVVDTPVFLIPSLLVLWLLAASGVEAVTGWLARAPRLAASIAVAALLVPVWNVSRTFASNDRSDDVQDAVYLDRLFDALPARAVLAHEDFIVDRMVMFKLLGERAGRDRRIESAPEDAIVLRDRLDEGVAVFAFQKSVKALRYDALDFAYDPLPLADGPPDQFLSHLPRGSVVTIAVPAHYAVRFASTAGVSFDQLGGPSRLTPRTASVVITGVVGASTPARVETSAEEAILNVGAAASRLAGSEAWARSASAAIRRGARDLVRTDRGAVLAVWNEDGRLAHTAVLDAIDDFRVPLPIGALSVFRLRGAWPRQDVSPTEWRDLTRATASGSLMVRVPARGSVTLYVADEAALAPRLFDRSSDLLEVTIRAIEDPASDALDARRVLDLVSGLPRERAGYVYKIEVAASGGEPVSALLALGGRPTHAVGRAGSASGASVFPINTDGLLRSPDRGSRLLTLARDDQAQLVGAGWSEVESDAAGAFRWMTATTSRLVLPSVGLAAPRRIRLEALQADASGARTIALRINGVDQGAQTLRAGWQGYEWVLPPQSLSAGSNEVTMVVDRLATPDPKRAREVAVASLRVISD
jgi:Protein O-mannosyl-transferase TMEM260-like